MKNHKNDHRRNVIMESYVIFKDLAIIIVFAKFFGLVARKIKVPQVAGEIIAGLLIGPSVLGLVAQSDFLSKMAEIGVVLLMFTAGLGTDLKEMKKTGVAAFLVACCGVAVPLIGGTILYSCFYGWSAVGSEHFLKAVFIGCIMTATSVSITVEALRELGHLNGRVGTTIMSAAIIDDVIGIIVLTFVIAFKDPDVKPLHIVTQTALFFLFAFVVGYLLYKVFQKVDQRYPHTRRIPIAGLALCLAMSYVAEKYFGIADITGAFVAGIILCNIRDSKYIAEKMDVESYMMFGPIFFASIGLKTDIGDLNTSILLFSAAFIIVALITKIIGCGLISKVCGFSWGDSLKIGVGMMTRGEVALIVSQKGLAVGLMEPVYFTSVILLIIVSSIATPVVLKILYAKEGAHEV